MSKLYLCSTGGSILCKTMVDASTNLQALKVALHLMVVRYHPDYPVLEEWVSLVWPKHADGDICVNYVVEMSLERPTDINHCWLCWSRTSLKIASSSAEEQSLCEECRPEALCDSCVAVAGGWWGRPGGPQVCFRKGLCIEWQEPGLLNKHQRRRVAAIEAREKAMFAHADMVW